MLVFHNTKKKYVNKFQRIAPRPLNLMNENKIKVKYRHRYGHDSNADTDMDTIQMQTHIWTHKDPHIRTNTNPINIHFRFFHT